MSSKTICARIAAVSLLTVCLLLSTVSIAQAQTCNVRFAVIGDYGRAGQPERDVAELVKGWSPDFVITVGDNNYEDGAASTIDQNVGQYYHDFIGPYLGSYGEGAATNRFFPVLGNHDWQAAGARPYLDYFTLPGNERYYEVAYGPVHLFALDSDPSEPDGVRSDSAQANWLRARRPRRLPLLRQRSGRQEPVSLLPPAGLRQPQALQRRLRGDAGRRQP